jgi:hypothetical protein
MTQISVKCRDVEEEVFVYWKGVVKKKKRWVDESVGAAETVEVWEVNG